MSKIYKAIKKQEEERQLKSERVQPKPLNPYSAGGPQSVLKTMSEKKSVSALVVILVVCLVTVIALNITILNEIKVTKAGFISLKNNINHQQNEFKNLGSAITNFESDRSDQTDKLKTEMSDLRNDLFKQEHDLSVMSIENGLMKMKVKDLESSEYVLLEKYIKVNQKLEKINTKFSQNERDL